jgi:hypothetical protein
MDSGNGPAVGLSVSKQRSRVEEDGCGTTLNLVYIDLINRHLGGDYSMVDSLDEDQNKREGNVPTRMPCDCNIQGAEFQATRRTHSKFSI